MPRFDLGHGDAHVEAGLTQGRRKVLTGGGLIRSFGGWTDGRARLHGRNHVMSDERILGDPDFFDSVISKSEEWYKRRYELRR
ncbi:MAG: hypothetical protein SVY10_21485 [Thermodesulfobacteriota bacterium]|nr:hypothetical protein [Thermodesulfobacteriota bacterium]